MNQNVKQTIMKRIQDIESQFDAPLSLPDRENICLSAYQDLKSFSTRDPSSHNDMLYIFSAYLSYKAVLYYRIAHELHINGDIINARRISEYAKLKTGIEIHPACVIGKRFVLDHGIGTVIGETTVIGDDCYVLQSVIFGSKHIACNKEIKRHPVIGNNVEVGGHVKIYGNVKIGNHVIIGPGAIIKEDIKDHSKVVVATDYQIQRGNSRILFTGYKEFQNQITVYFKNADLSELNNIKVYSNDVALPFSVNENSIKFYKCSNNSKYYRFIFSGEDAIDICIR